MKTNPAVMLENDPQWLHPLQAGPRTLFALACDPATLEAVDAVLARLVPDPYIEHMRKYYALGRERFGAHWNYADQLTVLHAAAKVLRPRSYLEIGVFRGRSLSVVASVAPSCVLHAFDLWIPGYAGLDNAGPELVREQLRRVGHAGELHIESGDSHETVPRFLEQHPDLGFDLVTVDGDHTEEGARRDLELVLPRVNVGGALVFDDIRHPRHPWLERVWDETVAALPSFACAKFVEVGAGVALAVRRQDDDDVTGTLHGDGVTRLAQLTQALEELRAKRVERIEVLETEMARRLEIIERQGVELGRLPVLDAEVARLRAHVEFAEADRARRLQIIEEQGAALGGIPALEAEIAHLREQLRLAELECASRLDRLLHTGEELGRLRADVAEQLAVLQAWVTRHMSGLFLRRHGRAVLAMLADASARLGSAGGNGAGPTPAHAGAPESHASAAPLNAVPAREPGASNSRAH